MLRESTIKRMVHLNNLRKMEFRGMDMSKEYLKDSKERIAMLREKLSSAESDLNNIMTAYCIETDYYESLKNFLSTRVTDSDMIMYRIYREKRENNLKEYKEQRVIWNTLMLENIRKERRNELQEIHCWKNDEMLQAYLKNTDNIVRMKAIREVYNTYTERYDSVVSKYYSVLSEYFNAKKEPISLNDENDYISDTHESLYSSVMSSLTYQEINGITQEDFWKFVSDNSLEEFSENI